MQRYKIKLTSTLLLCAGILAVSIIPSLSKPITIDKSLERITAGMYIDYLEDSEGNLTIDDITSGSLDDKWIKSENEKLGFGFTSSIYWVRLELENTSRENIEIYLEHAYPSMDYITIYMPRGKGFKEVGLGDRKPFNERPYEYQNFILPLKLKRKEAAVYYLKHRTEGAMNIYIYIWSPKDFIKNILKKSMFQWMFYGILLIMIIYNLFIFFSTRDPAYFYLILYITAITVSLMSLNGLAFQHLWPESIWWTNSSTPFSHGISVFSMVQFARYLMRTMDREKDVIKYADIPLKVIMIIALSLSILTLIINNYSISIIISTSLIAIASISGLIIALIYLFIPGPWVRPTRFFLSAIFILLVGILLYIFKTFTLLPTIFITSYGMEIGFVIFVALLSFALADKINVMKNQLQGLNLHLEDKVEERTEELQAAMEELESVNNVLVQTNNDLEEAQRIAKLDMIMAANIQTTLLPKEAPKIDGWDVAFMFKPMSGVSGDLYDFYIENNQLNGISIFDVSGHGIASGLITMIAKPVFHNNFNEGRNNKLHNVLEKANKDLIKEMGEVGNYITGILLRFNENNVEYVNAAHSDLICKRSKSGSVEFINRENEDFRGMFLGEGYTEGTYNTLDFKTNDGDILILHTDCLYENKNLNNEEYGFERLKTSIINAPDASSQELLDYILNDFHDFVGDDNFHDDLTVIVLKKI